jgi:hypothetical protein
MNTMHRPIRYPAGATDDKVVGTELKLRPWSGREVKAFPAKLDLIELISEPMHTHKITVQFHETYLPVVNGIPQMVGPVYHYIRDAFYTEEPQRVSISDNAWWADLKCIVAKHVSHQNDDRHLYYEIELWSVQ